jgi:hypothetical protein
MIIFADVFVLNSMEFDKLFLLYHRSVIIESLMIGIQKTFYNLIYFPNSIYHPKSENCVFDWNRIKYVFISESISTIVKYQKYHWVIRMQNWKNILFLLFLLFKNHQICVKVRHFSLFQNHIILFLSWNWVIYDWEKKNHCIPMICLLINRMNVLLIMKLCMMECGSW